VEPGASLSPFLAELDYPMFIVTTVDPQTGERAGCLIGFASQCSIEPDRFVVWLSEHNHTYRVAHHAQLLAVHSLTRGQHDLAVLFATRTGDEVDKFARCDWEPGPSGVPILTGCPHWFVGTILDRVVWGNHTGFLLDPVQSHGRRQGPPLMFSDVRDLRAGHPA
jgi:flavin reductase (DIM6/NTAB) family NADH-FMN oxidoreductase RutF